jgi:hypothetical protein
VEQGGCQHSEKKQYDDSYILVYDLSQVSIPACTSIIPMICVLLHHILYVEESIVPARGSEIARDTAGISNVYRTADRHGNRYRARIGGQCAGSYR